MDTRTRKKDGTGNVIQGLRATLEQLQAERHTGSVVVEIFMKQGGISKAEVSAPKSLI